MKLSPLGCVRSYFLPANFDIDIRRPLAQYTQNARDSSMGWVRGGSLSSLQFFRCVGTRAQSDWPIQRVDCFMIGRPVTGSSFCSFWIALSLSSLSLYTHTQGLCVYQNEAKNELKRKNDEKTERERTSFVS